jgi:hypothetical protein
MYIIYASVREDVCDHPLRFHLDWSNSAILEGVSDEMMFHVNMPDPRMENWIFHKFDGALIIAVQHYRLSWCT